MTEEERKKEFLEGLALLTRRYKISVSGCGCCGSPLLWDHETNSGPSIKWDEKSETYKEA